MESRFRGMQSVEGQKPSLKQILKEHYNNRDFTVKKDVANTYGVCYFLYTIFTQCYVGGWTLIPTVASPSTASWWKFICLFIFAQVFFNWFACCRKYVNKVIKRPEDESRTDLTGWYFCAICQQPAPPRAHHCKLCKACILRHDHHCYFAAGCIGFSTICHFVFMCLWILIAECCALYWFGLYIYTMFRAGVVTYIPPMLIFNVLAGEVSLFDAFLIVNLCFTIVNVGVVAVYLFLETLSTINNVTFYEGSKGIRRYNQGSYLANARATLGSFWWIRWLIPFPCLPEGNGYDWTVTERREQ